MKDKTKRTWLVVLGVLVCIALVVAIAGRFSRSPSTDEPAMIDEIGTGSEPVVDINTEAPGVSVIIDGGTSDLTTTDPGAGADSSGSEQTIQADPVKPDAPEAPTTVEDNHDAASVPESERNAETPPTYSDEQTTVTKPSSEPTGGSSNAAGQIYVPGFGYMESSGEGAITENKDMYENGNKVGIMD